jgi:hypothetical protein
MPFELRARTPAIPVFASISPPHAGIPSPQDRPTIDADLYLGIKPSIDQGLGLVARRAKGLEVALVVGSTLVQGDDVVKFQRCPHPPFLEAVSA